MSHRHRRGSTIPPSEARIISVRTPGSGQRLRAVADVAVVRPGCTVAGRFRVERKLGAGGMGDVWQGVHSELRLRVAIKTLRADVLANPEVVARFSREAFLLGRIQSDHVARVIDFIADTRLGPVLVTEYVDGPSLQTVLARGKLTVEEAVDLGIDLLSGLRELHRARIVHRDVKPANVLLRRIEGGRLQAVFVDLGVSRMVRDDEAHDECLTEITRADRSVGTYEYMAPEQVLSCRDVAPSADLYAVGGILYRAVSGHHAFGELHGAELLKRKLSGQAPALVTGRGDRVALAFEALVARALAMSPDERYESADEMLTELSHLRDSARRAAREARTRATIPPPPLSSVPPSLEPPPHPSHPSLPRASVAAARGARRVRLTVALAFAVAGIGVGLVAGTAFAARTLRSASALRLDDRACTLVPTVEHAPGGRTAYAIVCADEPRAP